MWLITKLIGVKGELNGDNLSGSRRASLSQLVSIGCAIRLRAPADKLIEACMESDLQQLVDGFEKNRLAAGKAIRELVESDRASFIERALALLKKAPDEPGCDYILTLLSQDEHFLTKLCDPSILSLCQAAEIAKRAQKADSHFDVRVMRRIQSALASDSPADARVGERLLELMSACADVGRVVPLLAQLLRSANPRVRSKTVLLIGRVTSSAKFAECWVHVADKRVRANAVEGLWGNQAVEARTVLFEAASDPDNRVAANAMLGLYKLGDTRSLGLLQKMADHPSAAFRASAAWAMKAAADSRFDGTLARLLSDDDPRVRQNAVRATAYLRNLRARLRSSDRLQIFLGEPRLAAGSTRMLRAGICSKPGKSVNGLAPLQFLLEEGGRSVLDYVVRELPSPDSLAFGIAIPGLPQQTAEFRRITDAAGRRSLEWKRHQDHCEIVRYDAGSEKGTTGDDDAAGADELADVPLADALRRLVAEIGQKKSERHLLFLDCPELYSSGLTSCDVDKLIDVARSARVRVHGFILAGRQSCAESQAWRLCRETGGDVDCVATLFDLVPAIDRFYCNQLGCYEITYASNAGRRLSHLTVRVETPDGSGEATREID